MRETNIEKTKRKEILDTAKRLYYDKGMDAVSFDDIAKEVGVTKPVIAYHFGNKAKLANEIFGRYSKANANTVYQKAYALSSRYTNYDINQAYTILCCRYYCQDEKALRFYTQLFSCSFTDITYGIEDISNITLKGPSGNVSEDIAHMLYIGTQYAARGLIYHYATGEIKCSEQDFNRYMMQIGVLGIMTEEQTERVLKNAYNLLDELEIDFAEYFEWR